ncbi:MAG: SprT-like domain-containing protein [Haloarculaceae archaeon]
MSGAVDGAVSGDAPRYDEIDSHEGLIAWSRAYCKRARREWLVDVRFDLLEWAVSTRAKRRAAAVVRPKIPEATVGEPIDWGRATTADGRTAEGRPFPCTMRLTWDAFETFDRAEWEATLRHELIHVEQYQRFGTTGHGSAFKARAEELETTVHCSTFATPKYVLRCGACDGTIARRYRECKLVRRHDEYESACCGASLRCERPAAD